MSAKKAKAKPVKLSPEDLDEFKLRSAALQNARATLIMLQESFLEWSKGLRDRYGLPGKFEVNVQTGRAAPAEGDKPDA